MRELEPRLFLIQQIWQAPARPVTGSAFSNISIRTARSTESRPARCRRRDSYWDRRTFYYFQNAHKSLAEHYKPDVDAPGKPQRQRT